jgi:Putative Ig domain
VKPRFLRLATGLSLVAGTAMVALSSALASAQTSATLGFRGLSPVPAATGQVTVIIRTPRGVAANVILSGPAKALFAKPAAGTSIKISRRLAAGSYRVKPQPVVERGVLYESSNHQTLTVPAGGSVSVIVSFARVPSASALHVTKITTTRITLAWSAPKGATFAMRRAAGTRPPATRKGGAAVPVSGLTATDTGLTAGKKYAYALFTHIDGHWAGPVTQLAGTAPPTGSKAASFATASGTLLATSTNVLSAAGTGTGARVTLSGVTTPVLGSAVVLPASTALPGGYIGLVTGISANGSTVTLKAAALSAAFSYYDVNVSSFASTATQWATTAVDSAATSSGLVSCDSSPSVSMTFTPSVRLAGYFHATINTTNYLHVARGASLSMSLTATVTGAMSVQATASLSCELKLPDVFKVITADPVPIAVKFSPTADISFDSALEADNLGVTVTGGVQFSGTLGLSSGAQFTGSDILTATPLTPSFTQTGTVGAKLGGQLIVGPGAGDTSAGVIAGLSGQFDPLEATVGPQSQQNPSCLQVTADRSWQLGLIATAWLRSWSVDANVTFSALTGHSPYPGSPWYFPSGCQNVPAVSGGALPAGQVGVPYDQFLAASGGAEPYSWTVTSGSLPPGITPASSGELSGTPTANGSSQFTAQVTDANNATASGAFTVTVNPAVTTPSDISSYTVSPDLGCDMSGAADPSGEFFGDTACGTIIAAGGQVYGPASIPAGSSLTGAASYNPWTPVNQTTTGSGTAGDPYVITTDVAATGSPITASQTDTYVTDGSTVATATTLTNTSGSPVQLMLYHAFDCYPGNSDYGYGYGSASGGSVSCESDNVTASGAQTLQLAPASGGSTYVEEYYDSLWSDIATGNPFSDTVQQGDHDTSEGLAWPVTVPAGGSVTVQYSTNLLLTQG